MLSKTAWPLAVRRWQGIEQAMELCGEQLDEELQIRGHGSVGEAAFARAAHSFPKAEAEGVSL